MPVAGRDGLRITMARIPDLTQKGLLVVPMTLQCPPLEEFATAYAYTFNDYETIRAGQFTRPNAVQLRTITFDTLAVDTGVDEFSEPTPSWVVANEGTVEDYRDNLIKVCESGSPFLLAVAHPTGPTFVGFQVQGAEVMMPATLRTLTVTEKAGEGDARYFNINFVEYKDPFVSRAKQGKRRRGSRTDLPTTVRLDASGNAFLKSGQKVTAQATLARLSKQFYGDPFFALEIARANNLVWGPNQQLTASPKYARGGKVTIPKPSTDFPTRDDFAFLSFHDWAGVELG